VFGRRRQDRQEQAVIARADAAGAFAAMDELARQVSDRLMLAAHVDGGPRGQALLDRLRGVSAQADSVAAEWLGLAAGTTLIEVVEPGDDLAEQTALAYQAVRGRLELATEGFERLIIDVGPELGDIEQALAAIPRRVHEARQSMHDAQAAVEALRLDGLAPEAAEQALIRVYQRAEVLDEGPAVHGITEILAAADGVVAIAAEARRSAEQFPHQRDDIARRLVSVRSRLETTEDKGTRLEAALAALQRGYAEGSWLDLAEAPDRFQAALDDAEDALEQAQASSRRLAYPPALRLLEGARSALTRADEQVRQVTRRLATLDGLQGDPRAPMGPVQFALDDAQLLCERAPAPEEGRQLEALEVRLKSAPALIEMDNPDYYGYLVELDAIKLETAKVVEDLRRG
jgi:hypothetical protein